MSERQTESHAVTRLVSPDEREAAVKLLTTAFADDVIAVDEFERRVAAVYGAESSGALQEVISDLPAPAATGPAPVPAVVEAPTPLVRRSSQQVQSVLSAVERRVDGPMPERLDVRSVLGSVELDLRRAEFPPGVTEIHLKAVFGSIEIELPEHVRVEDEGHAILGMFSVSGRSRRREDGEDTPVVRITGRSLFGSVEVELDD